MLATIINASRSRTGLKKNGVPTRVQKRHYHAQVAGAVHSSSRGAYLEKGRVVIFGAARASLFFHRHGRARLRANEIARKWS